MKGDAIGRRGQAISQWRTTLQRRLAALAYQFQPDRPNEALGYIPISANARKLCFPKGVPLPIVVWNTFKGRRERYYDFLSEQTADSELILLQEFRHDPLLEASHSEIFAQRDAGMAVSFYTEPNRGSPTGVCTVSSVRAIKTQLLISRYFEPVTRTPKTAICTYYPIDTPDCRPEEALLVLNSHGINFRLRRPFLDQMLQFEEQLRHHQGPIILVGDFNTWEKGRIRILEAVVKSIGLTHVRFPIGIKTWRGHELDRVYIRGGTASQQRVFSNAGASDHSMLAFKFAMD